MQWYKFYQINIFEFDKSLNKDLTIKILIKKIHLSVIDILKVLVKTCIFTQ